VWLPDGRGVIVQGADLQGQQGLFLVSADTGALTTIVEGRAVWFPHVSPDGHQVFFRPCGRPRAYSDGCGIAVRDLASGAEKPVTTDGVIDFALSPDGKWIAWTQPPAKGPGPCAFIIPSSGGEARALPAISGGRTDPTIAWSRDGRVIFVVKSKVPNGEGEVWQVPVDGSAPRDTGIRLAPSEGAARIDAHPDGRRLAISTGTSSLETWVLQNLPAARGK
jgi:Tol biopolymer transport system component